MDLALHGYGVMRLAGMSKRRRYQAGNCNGKPGKFGKSNHLAGFSLVFWMMKKGGIDYLS